MGPGLHREFDLPADAVKESPQQLLRADIEADESP